MKRSIDEVINIIQHNPPFKDMPPGMHGKKHANNVLFFANKLATILKEKKVHQIDFKSLAVVALLHDCGRFVKGDGSEHATRSAILAKKFIKDQKIDCDTELVVKIIKSHCPPKGLSLQNLPIECKILGDADKLDRFRSHHLKQPLKVELLELKESFSLINFAARVNNHKFRIVPKSNPPFTKRRGVQIHPDYVCNNNCRFCITSDLKVRKYLSTSEIIKRLDNLNIDENTYITLVGGEATIRPDIIKLIKYISERGGKPCLLSNGRRFAYRDFTLKMLRAGLREVRISIYGHNAKLHDWLTRAEGSFNQTMQGVKNLLAFKEKYGFPLLVEAKTLVCKPAAPHLPEIIKLFCKEFPNPDVEIGIYGMAMRGNASKNINDVGIRLLEAKDYIKKALDIGISFNRKIRLIDVPLCILGDLKYLPYYRKKSPSELQTTENKRSQKLKPTHEQAKNPRCKLCKIDKKCSGLWIYYAKVYGTNELIPFRI